jgi:hypothetical protein
MPRFLKDGGASKKSYKNIVVECHTYNQTNDEGIWSTPKKGKQRKVDVSVETKLDRTNQRQTRNKEMTRGIYVGKQRKLEIYSNKMSKWKLFYRI